MSAPGPSDDGRLPAQERHLLHAARLKSWGPFLLTAVLGLASLVWVLLTLPNLPEQVPTHWGPSGTPDAWSATSFAAVAQGPLIGLGTAGFLALVAAVLPAMSPAPQDRSGWARVRGLGMHLGMVAALGWISLLTLLAAAPTTVQVLLSDAAVLPWWLMPLVLTVVILGVFIALSMCLRRARRWAERTADALGYHATAQERAEEERWTTTGLMDDPDEPSMLVSRREGYGLGATVNIGSPGGRLLYRGFLVVFAVGLPALFWILSLPGA